MHFYTPLKPDEIFQYYQFDQHIFTGDNAGEVRIFIHFPIWQGPINRHKPSLLFSNILGTLLPKDLLNFKIILGVVWWYLSFLTLRGMILNFWSWCDISVTSNRTCRKSVHDTNISFVYTLLWQFYGILRGDWKSSPKQPYPQCTDLSSTLCI